MSVDAQVVFNVLTLVALVAGPVFAIQTQEFLERRRERTRRKLHIFRELMVTRGTILAPPR